METKLKQMIKLRNVNYECGKEFQTINFDREVIQTIKAKAKELGTSTSNLVNFMCKQQVMKESEFCSVMARFHNREMQEWIFKRDEALKIKELEKDQNDKDKLRDPKEMP